MYRIVCKRGLLLLEGKEAVGRLEFQQRRPGPAGGPSPRRHGLFRLSRSYESYDWALTISPPDGGFRKPGYRSGQAGPAVEAVESLGAAGGNGEFPVGVPQPVREKDPLDGRFDDQILIAVEYGFGGHASIPPVPLSSGSEATASPKARRAAGRKAPPS